mgnify:CR=1 FL=1
MKSDSKMKKDVIENIEDGTVGKALYILELISEFDTPQRFSDIQKCSPFPKASTYRLVTTLLNQRMLVLDERTARYSMGGRLIKLASKAWKNTSLGPIAAPYIDKLSVATGQTIHLAKLDNGQVLYLDKRNANRPIPMFSDAGKVAPVYCTGVGKAMLAFSKQGDIQRIIAQQSFYRFTEHTIISGDALLQELENIRNEGCAYDREEHETGIICLAVPIVADSGLAVAGLSVTLSTRQYSLEDLASFRAELEQTAKEISKAAGDWLLNH